MADSGGAQASPFGKEKKCKRPPLTKNSWCVGFWCPRKNSATTPPLNRVDFTRKGPPFRKILDLRLRGVHYERFHCTNTYMQEIIIQISAKLNNWKLSYIMAGNFLGARPASLAHKISYWRTDIMTFGPLGAPRAHRFTYHLSTCPYAISPLTKMQSICLFIMLARTLIQGADLFPLCRQHFVRNATRLAHRSEFPCYV